MAVLWGVDQHAVEARLDAGGHAFLKPSPVDVEAHMGQGSCVAA